MAKHTILDDGKRIALFLSRIHPKKGLEHLIEAWAIIKPLGWRLRIAGPDEAGYAKKILELIRINNLENSVDYIGEVEGKAKEELYCSSSLFVLPTFSENFGIVVAESLSYGVPVITTKGAPWEDLIKHQCGWWIDIGVIPLTDALKQAMNLTDKDRKVMGMNGKKYVKRFNWSCIAQQITECYLWILEGNCKPSFVLDE